MIVDALILAGGRSSRLDASAKQKLLVDGMPLLERTLDAVRGVGARHVVVVGDEAPDGVVAVRESPAFAGPVAGIAAGFAVLAPDADVVLVLACDMPQIAAALPVLLDGFAGDGAIATDRGRRQQLVLALSPDALARALEALPAVVDTPVRDLFASLDLTDIAVPEGATDDIDTWEDAARFGVARPTPLERIR
jgi:Molybdopterin-guanine dinucleotide biosynthesis protein A